ncbi:MAG: hypothetical protein ACI4MH_06760 [Candidatus Coproplasma sp.]
MRILTVSNRIDVLKELIGHIGRAYPEAEVIGETDPLMACKYAFNNAVDAVFADANMKRMTGLQLINFIRRENSQALTYLVGSVGEINACTPSVENNLTGIVLYPFTEESFTGILKV